MTSRLDPLIEYALDRPQIAYPCGLITIVRLPGSPETIKCVIWP